VSPHSPTVTRNSASAREAWRLLRSNAAAARTLAQQVLVGTTSPSEQHWGRLILAQLDLDAVKMKTNSETFRMLADAFRADQDWRGHIIALSGMSRIARDEGDCEGAYQFMHESLEAHGDALENLDAFLVYNSFGAVCFDLGHLEESLRSYYRALDMARALADPSAECLVLENLGAGQFSLGNLEEATALLRRGHQLSQTHGLTRFEHLAAGNFAGCQLVGGDPEGALATVTPLLGRKLEIRQNRDRVFEIHVKAVAAHALTLLGRREEARPLASQFVAEATEINDRNMIAYGAWIEGLLARADGDLQRALERLRFADSTLVATDDPFYAVEVTGELASLQAALGRWKEAYDTHVRHHTLRVAILKKTVEARYATTKVQANLAEAERERDIARQRQGDAEQSQRVSEQLNGELAGRMEEIELLQEQQREQATRDALTGLYNRRMLDETLAREIAAAKRGDRELVVAMLDIDHFKELNDAYGHAGGDVVLAGLARYLEEGLRRNDIPCRYGGEEFCILMPDTGAAAAVECLARLLGRFAALEFRISSTVIAKVTFSAGVASHRDGDDMASLLLRADEALYEAKRAGRNRVHMEAAA
jgi:two-component system cell cycle response regulator